MNRICMNARLDLLGKGPAVFFGQIPREEAEKRHKRSGWKMKRGGRDGLEIWKCEFTISAQKFPPPATTPQFNLAILKMT